MKSQLEKDREALNIARQELDWKHSEVESLENAVNYGRCELCNSPLMFDEKQHCGDYPNCKEFLNDSVERKNMSNITKEKKLELILRKFHGHTKEQWESVLVKEYPYCEIPYLVEIVWKEAQESMSILSWIEEQIKKYETLKYNSELWKGEGHTLTNNAWNRALAQERNMGEYETLLKIKKIIEKC